MPPTTSQNNVELTATSQRKSKVLAYAYLNGPFDHNKMSLAPMGSEVRIYKKTDNRGTWAYHSVDGWYLYTSSEHYRTHNCHVKATRSEQLSDTVQFQVKGITNLTVTHANKLVNAIVTCINAVCNFSNAKNKNNIRTSTSY